MPFLMLMLMSHCGSLVAYAYAYVASEDQALQCVPKVHIVHWSVLCINLGTKHGGISVLKKNKKSNHSV